MIFNLAFWLSLVLAAGGCAGLLLAGKGRWYGWGIGLAIQPVWATYAILTHGYGLLLTCLMYGGVYSKNLLRWRRDAKIAHCLHIRTRATYGDEAGYTTSLLRNPYRAYCRDCPKTWVSLRDYHRRPVPKE